MIAFNERLEAANLLRLLKESRGMLAAFNLDDRRIARESGADPDDPDAAAQALLTWYLRLALWEEERRLSGRYSLVFSRMDRIQRAPYDLLACYPLTDEEQERAQLPPELLAGLNRRASVRVLRLYHRLLCITPMRRLLERLHELARLVRRDGADREKLLQKLRDLRWRRAIAMTEERSSGQSLRVRDNDFTILDRLMANRGRVLRRRRIVRIPRSLLGSADTPEALLLAAIAGSLDRTEERGRCAQYRMIPGGHVRLDVYRSGAAEEFLGRAEADQEKRADRLVYIRQYAGYRLIQLPEKVARSVPYEARRRLRRSRSWADRRWRRHAPSGTGARLNWLEDPAIPQDWQALCSRILSLTEPQAPALLTAEAISLPDNGGSAAYRALRDALAAVRESPRKEAAPADNERCMFEFFKRNELAPLYLERAIAELRRHVGMFFAAETLPDKYSNDPAQPIARQRKNWQARAIKLLLAYAAGEGLIADERKKGEIPATVAATLEALETDGQERQRFWNYMAALEEQPEVKVTVNVKYLALEKRTLFLCYATPLKDHSAVWAWMKAGGGAQTGMSAEVLREACAFGLRRHLFMNSGVTTPSGKGFRLNVNPQGLPREPDVLFRLFVINAALSLAGAQDAPVGTSVEATLSKDYQHAEKSFLSVAGKGTLSFVGQDEQTGKPDAQLAPERLPDMASLALRWNLEIKAGPEEDRVTLQRVT